MYQEFRVDDERLFPIYESIQKEGLILQLHAGFDIGYPDSRSAEPSRMLAVRRKFPGLVLLATHIGGWRAWDEVDEFLAGEDIYFDTSFSLDTIAPGTLASIISKHSIDKILLGSDSPWRSQELEIDLVRRLDISDEAKKKILGLNAEKLLSLV
jgi:predicted TIM-barrel fold metal-dependent hydrolase